MSAETFALLHAELKVAKDATARLADMVVDLTGKEAA